MFRTQTHNRKCLSLQSKQHNPQILNRLNRPAAAMKRGGGGFTQDKLCKRTPVPDCDTPDFNLSMK